MYSPYQSSRTFERWEKPAAFEITSRTTLHRLPVRGSYEREAAYAILDEGLVCSVGVVIEGQLM